MQGLLGAANLHVAVVGIRIGASNTKVLSSALIPGEQRQADLLEGEPLEDVDKFKYLGSINSQGTMEARNRINLARSDLSRLQSCLWSWREISLRTKGRVYRAVVRPTLLFNCETWHVRVACGLYNDSIRRILYVRSRNCMPLVELRCLFCLTSIPALIVQ